MSARFYGPEQAAIHHERFGMLAEGAATELLDDLARRGRTHGTVIDLGCGTGILARAVSNAGYDVIGVDMSPAMLDVARAHAPVAAFRVGSAHDVELPSGCVAVTAIGEVLNYATDERAGLDSLTRLAARVRDALVDGGVFLLDLSGPGRAGPTGVVKQFHRTDAWCLGMTATESSDHRRLDRAITMFVAGSAGTYQRVDEHHVLHLYDASDVADRMQHTGFDVEITERYGDGDPLPGWYVVRAHRRG